MIRPFSACLVPWSARECHPVNRFLGYTLPPCFPLNPYILVPHLTSETYFICLFFWVPFKYHIPSKLLFGRGGVSSKILPIFSLPCIRSYRTWDFIQAIILGLYTIESHMDHACQLLPGVIQKWLFWIRPPSVLPVTVTNAECPEGSRRLELVGRAIFLECSLSARSLSVQ